LNTTLLDTTRNYNISILILIFQGFKENPYFEDSTIIKTIKTVNSVEESPGHSIKWKRTINILTRIYLTDPNPFKITINRPRSVFANLYFLSCLPLIKFLASNQAQASASLVLASAINSITSESMGYYCRSPLSLLSSLLCIDLYVTVSFSLFLFLNFAIRFMLLLNVCMFWLIF
jgi:hypothetical protein